MKNLVQVSEYASDTLILSIDFPLQTGSVALRSGQGILLRGSVIGKNSEGQFELANLAEDIIADSILANDVNTGVDNSTRSVPAVVYVSGSFNRNALFFGGNDTANLHTTVLRQNGIYLGVPRNF